MSDQEVTRTSVLDLLKRDHRKVEGLFAQLAHAEGDEQKVTFARWICIELSVHAEAEERVVYPAAREALGDEGEDLVLEATVEHRSLKHLIAEIDGSSPKDELFEANLKVLEEYVDHHVKEEEKELFPKLEQAAAFDQLAVGEKLLVVKAQLMKRVDETPNRGRGGIVHVPALKGAPAAKAKPAPKKKPSRAA